LQKCRCAFLTSTRPVAIFSNNDNCYQGYEFSKAKFVYQQQINIYPTKLKQYINKQKFSVVGISNCCGGVGGCCVNLLAFSSMDLKTTNGDSLFVCVL
jgi:hypothetical protein